MASEGPLSGSSASNSGSGTAWASLSNVYASDNAYANTGAFNLSPGQATQYGVVTGYGFSIPSGATIDGILIEEEINGSIFASSINALRVVKGGTISTTNLSTASLTSSDAYYSGGGSSNLCGETWTDSDINASNFGSALKVQSDAWPAHSFQWDHSRITVYYTSGDTTAPILTSPSAQPTSQTKSTGYVTTDEANGTLYEVATTSATKPSAAQVKAGQDHTGSSATWSGSQSISSTGQKTCTATGLSAGTTYYFHFMHEDAAANQSTVVSSAAFITRSSGEPTLSGSMTTGPVLYPIFAAKRPWFGVVTTSTVNVQFTVVLPIAYQQSIIKAETAPVAYNQAGIAANPLPIAYQQSTLGTATAPLAWQEEALGVAVLPISYQQEGLSAEVLPMAWNQEVIGASTFPVAWNQSSVLGDTFPMAWNQSQLGSSVLPISWQAEITAGAVLPVSWDSEVNTASVLPIAWNSSALLSGTTPVAWNGGGLLGETLPIAWNQEALAASVLPVSWDENVLGSSVLTLAWQSSHIGSSVLPMAWNQGAVSSAVIPLAWLQGTISTQVLPIAWEGSRESNFLEFINVYLVLPSGTLYGDLSSGSFRLDLPESEGRVDLPEGAARLDLPKGNGSIKPGGGAS